VSTPESKTESASGKDALPRIRPVLSQHQKQRSKLKQATEETIAEEPKPVPPPEPRQPTPESPRRVRLKRSGQMHADLIAPIPPDPTKNEPEY
jgi:hypothetical protein